MNANSTAARYGLFAGLGTIAVMLLLYMVNAEMIFGWFLQATWLIYLFCMYKAVDDTKNENDGFITLREAFAAAFIVFAVANLMYMVFFYVLVNVIDPELIQMQIDKGIEMLENMSNTFAIPEKDMEEAIIAIEESAEQSIGQRALGYAMSLISGGIVSIILAGILKKERPIHLQDREDVLDTEV